MSSHIERFRRAGLFAGICAALAGCASYAKLPLDATPRLAHSIAELRLTAPGSSLPKVDPSKPLGAAEVAFLAVENNPDLQAARDARGLSQAQVLQAGLLPNPQFSGSYGALMGGPASFDAWSAGIGQDIKALVTLSAQKESAHYEALKVDADVLWQEWQVIGKARLLDVDLVEGEKQRKLLIETRALFAERYRRSKQALDRGDIDLATAAPDLAALSDIEKQINDLDRQQQTRRYDLAALLGLAPEVKLVLDETLELPRIDPAQVERLVSELPHRRPDLVALQLGYQSQEEKVRGAILAQFPALVFGGAAGSDTSHVFTAGPQITLDLPIFNRNQGNIAIERATRQKLHDEFSSRLSAAAGEVQALVREQALVQRQLDQVQAQLAEAEKVSSRAEAAFRAGNLDERGYVDLAMTRIAKQQQIIALEQTMLEQQVAIATLVGAGMPPITLPDAHKEQTS